jgi:hypothetical protein
MIAHVPAVLMQGKKGEEGGEGGREGWDERKEQHDVLERVLTSNYREEIQTIERKKVAVVGGGA